jgi:hypothetical protein
MIKKADLMSKEADREPLTLTEADLQQPKLKKAGLEQLILQLNPYMQQQVSQKKSDTAVAGGNDAPQRLMHFAHGVVRAGNGLDFSAFMFETQDDPAYRLDWTWMFKGQSRIIRRALRFQYYYPVQGGGGAMATDHMLIGYEGGGGP